MRTCFYETPIGTIRLGIDGDALMELYFVDGAEARASSAADCRPFGGRLDAYFAGDLDALDGIAVDVSGRGAPDGLTQRVWSALRKIPAGSTLSYQELAARIGIPRAARAVGTANGRNPVSLVIPCHRVIRADGTLGGYGGGLSRKAWLLAHERADCARQLSIAS